MDKLNLVKAEEPEIKLPTSIGSLKKKRGGDFHKSIYFCVIDYAKAFDCVDHSKLWKILQEMGIPDHLTCLLRNVYAGQEVTVRTGHVTTDWFQIGKGVHQGYILSLYLFTYMQCVCVCACVSCLVQLWATLCICDPTDYSPPDFSVHGVLQARILEWVAIPFSRGTS